jgi:hypothetical protein
MKSLLTPILHATDTAVTDTLRPITLASLVDQIA